MDKMNLDWLVWVMTACLFGGIVWQLLARAVRNRTLRKTRTPLGAPIYTWKTPLGALRTARSHPGLKTARGDGGFSGGDWGDCGDGGGD
ncbi:MAG: hypothetical protein ACX93P_08010 [Roseovarius sp.]|nr:hypothetical protein [Roseovarius sp.]